MHLLASLQSGFADAPGGTARIYRRGTTTAATCYTDFNGSYSTTTHTLDSRGRVRRYVNELVDIKVFNVSGTQVVETYTEGVAGTAVEIRHAHVTGTDYDTGASGLNKPTTLQKVLDKLYTTFGSDDFLVDSLGSDIPVVQALMPGIYSVRGYGAIGDGAVNDSPAIQLAIDAAAAAGGGTVYFPPGTYRVVTSPQISTTNIHWMGAGPAASVIKAAPSSSTGACVETITGGTSFTAQALGFAHDATAAGTPYLVKCTAASAMRFVQCGFTNTRNTFGCVTSGVAQYIACQFEASGSAARQTIELSASGDAAVLLGCRIATKVAQEFLSPDSGHIISVIGCAVEFSLTGAAFIDGSGGKVHLIGTRFSGDNASSYQLIPITPFVQVTEIGCVVVPGGGVTFGNGVLFSSLTRDSASLRTSGSSTTYTPDVIKIASHEVISSGASFQWSNPSFSPAIAGANTLLYLRYKNTSGGAITPTFGTAYKASAVSVANNSAQGWIFTYDTTLACWVELATTVAYAS